jgi:hypothetical protein
MSVKVASFDDPAAWGYLHDDAPGGSHGGTLDPATVTYGTNPDDTPNEMTVIVPCPHPGCGSVSYWPPGGGADALYGQMLHVQMAMRPPDGAASRGTKTAQDAAAEVKERVIATDGEERWVLDDAALQVLQQASA